LFARLCRIALLSLALPAASAHSDEIQIPGPSGPLGAELLAAENARDLVITIPGSGPIDRDGNAPNMGLASDVYKLLSEALYAKAVSSLRIDKRGFFSSAAAIDDPNDVTIAAYAEDVRNWIKWAAPQAECVWLAGHSEGGLVSLAAAQEPIEGLCGVILLAAPGRPIGTLMKEQFANNPYNAPILEDLNNIVTTLETGSEVPQKDIPGPVRTLFSPGVQRFMIDLFTYDPAQLAATWSGPTLILQGDADVQVTPVDAALLTANLPNATSAALPNGTHTLKLDVPGSPFSTYTNPALPLHPELVDHIVDFLSAHRP